MNLRTMARVFGAVFLLFTLMGWCHQVIREEPLSHDTMQQQADLNHFVSWLRERGVLAASPKPDD